jgi:hypothetical protein
MHDQKPEVWQQVADAKGLDDELTTAVDAAIEEFHGQYATRDDDGGARPSETATKTDEETVKA